MGDSTFKLNLVFKTLYFSVKCTKELIMPVDCKQWIVPGCWKLDGQVQESAKRILIDTFDFVSLYRLTIQVVQNLPLALI